MKHISLTLVFILIFIGCIFGCAENNHDGSTEKLSDEETFKKLFDFEMQYQPSDEEMEKITKGMPYNTVVEIIGRPHGFGEASSGDYLKWITEEGNCYVISFRTYSDKTWDDLLEYLNNSVVHSVPKMIK